MKAPHFLVCLLYETALLLPKGRRNAFIYIYEELAYFVYIYVRHEHFRTRGIGYGLLRCELEGL